MVPGNLADVFGSLAVGTVVLFIAMAICWAYTRPGGGTVPRQLYELVLHDRSKDTLFRLLLIPVIYAVGILIQDTTDHLTDTENIMFSEPPPGSSWTDPANFCPPALVRSCLEAECEHRMRALFKKDFTGDQTAARETEKDTAADKKTVVKRPWSAMLRLFPRGGRLRLTGLGKDVFGTEGFLNVAQSVLGQPTGTDDYLAFLREPVAWLNATMDGEGNPEPARWEKATACVNVLYYHAKNWCYMQDTLYDELESIQRRIDFSRSCFHVCMLAVAVVVSVLAVLSVKPLFPPWRREEIRGWLRYAGRSGVVLTLLVMVCLCCRYGYLFSEANFNERAFGYYLSHVRYETREEPDKSSKVVLLCSPEHACVRDTGEGSPGPRVESHAHGRILGGAVPGNVEAVPGQD